jgi:hypothetical protein
MFRGEFLGVRLWFHYLAGKVEALRFRVSMWVSSLKWRANRAQYKIDDMVHPVRTKQRELAVAVLGYPGRMISGSKTGYGAYYPQNFTCFNSNVCTKRGKLWHGDLDLTKDFRMLITLANVLNERIYVLYEMDGRFENESAPRLERARFIVDPGAYLSFAGEGRGVTLGEPDYYEFGFVDLPADRVYAPKLKEELAEHRLQARKALGLPAKKTKGKKKK